MHSVKELNKLQKELIETGRKYGMEAKELILPLKKGTYTISEPIVLVKQTTLMGE